VGLIAEESERAIIILDEVQELALISGPLLKMLANIFATHPRVVFVFTGSYFGVLRMLLEPPTHSPLFGRSPASLRLDPFPRETSVSFLAAGLKEYGVHHPPERLEALVDRSLDGVPGWLALYGSHVAVQRLPTEEAERLTVQEGKKVARNELAHFLESRHPGLYWTTLRALTPEASWSELRNALSARTGAAVNDNSVRRILRSLLDANIIVERDHRYSIGDPMVRAYVRDTTSPPRRTEPRGTGSDALGESRSPS
jgi:AAA+ ATPase superfamily predicted ATPase